jgi:hypothetical protein
MTDEVVTDFLRGLGPAFEPMGAPVRLMGGLINVVYRVPCAGGPVIVKHTSAFIASSPGVPLDTGRFEIERRALSTISGDDTVRPPRSLGADPGRRLLAMEDVGDHPHLGEWLEGASEDQASHAGTVLGTFIGQLHAGSAFDEAIRARFDNRPIQETRLAVQYRSVGPLLARLGIADAELLGREAEALGERLLEPGQCLVMGDLWPPSVRVTPAGLRLIDWEFAHFGRPFQDVAHLGAHLWMISRQRPGAAGTATACWEAFRQAYGGASGGFAGPLWDTRARRDADIHTAAEVLVRAAGIFQAGYLYTGLAEEAAPVREAIEAAVASLRGTAFGGI